MEWPVVPRPGGVLEGLPPAEARAAVRFAVEHLARWSGYGVDDATIRPCPKPAGAAPWRPPGTLFLPSHGRSPWQPALIGGRWYNLECGTCQGGCGCDSRAVIRFGFRVNEIRTVTLSGDPITGYRLDGHDLLTRTDGQDWPASNDLDAPSGFPGVWEVTLAYGTPAPEAGQLAASVLAEEVAKGIVGDPGCELPQRVQTITRQGVTIGMLDPMDGLENGKTGIWLVDSWLASLHAPRPARVRSVDVPAGRIIR